MNELTSIFNDTKKQMKQHFLMLFVWMLAAKVLGALLSELLSGVLVPSNQMVYMVISFVFTMVNILVVDTIMFLFIKTVRGESFHVTDIVSSVKMVLYHVLMGIVLSFLQAFMQQSAYLLSMIPILVYVVLFFFQAFFLYWNGLVAYAIYDQNKSWKDYLGGAFRMLMVNYKMILVMSLPYIAICVASQMIVGSIFMGVFGNLDTFNTIIASLMAAKGDVAMIAATYILYYAIQVALMVVMLQMIANLYDRYQSIYMPNQKRGIR